MKVIDDLKSNTHEIERFMANILEFKAIINDFYDVSHDEMAIIKADDFDAFFKFNFIYLVYIPYINSQILVKNYKKIDLLICISAKFWFPKIVN